MAAQPQPDVFPPSETPPSGTPKAGTLKTFGSAGPMYEVLGPAGISSQGQSLITIRVFGTGEVLDYPLDYLLTDPEAV